MIRRFQLLDPESRSSSRLASVGDRLRDGLLRDNKVLPVVLGFVAILVFAWLIAGVFMGGSGEEERASNQASLAQGEDPASRDTETPAPEIENRDTDSYSEFGASKDPFRDIIEKATEDDDETTTPRDGDRNGDDDRPNGDRPDDDRPDGNGSDSDRPGDDRPGADGPDGDRLDEDRPNGDRTGDDRPGGGSTGGDGGSIDQSFPGAPDLGGPGAGQGVTDQGTAGRQDDGLFNSGGDLPAP